MNFLTPLALVGLIALPILLILHLRRSQRRLVEVPSLLLWSGLVGEARQRTPWLRPPTLPLLLLQLLVVTLLVGSLARPVTTAAPLIERASRVYILDDSVWMSATDFTPDRITAAKDMVSTGVGRAPRGTLFIVIVASAQPYLLASSTDPSTVRRALLQVPVSQERADFVTALRLAAGALSSAQRQQSRITILHAPENSPPAITGLAVPTSNVTVGRNPDNQGIIRFSVRCPIDPNQSCGAFATVRNEYDRVNHNVLVIRGDGDLLAIQSLTLPPRADTNVSFPVPPGQRVVELELGRADILSADNTAWYVVGSNSRYHVMLIGDPRRTARVQRALAVLPGVSLQVGKPSQYRPAAAQRADLLVLDGWRPKGPLPPAPALFLIDPPSLPGGRIQASPPDATLSGEDAGSPLLSSVDLTSLDVPAQAAETVTLPSWASPVAWAPVSPLLSAGVTGGQRVAIMSFDPNQTNLPQLSAYPLLLWNILQWSGAWLPTNGVPGEGIVLAPPPAITSFQVTEALTGRTVNTISAAAAQPAVWMPPASGAYAVAERGAGVSRVKLLAINADTSPQPVVATVRLALSPLNRGSATTVITRSLVPWWPWIGLVALLIMVAEWLYVARSGG